jgi:hypothetical protein
VWFPEDFTPEWMQKLRESLLPAAEGDTIYKVR